MDVIISRSGDLSDKTVGGGTHSEYRSHSSHTHGKGVSNRFYGPRTSLFFQHGPRTFSHLKSGPRTFGLLADSDFGKNVTRTTEFYLSGKWTTDFWTLSGLGLWRKIYDQACRIHIPGKLLDLPSNGGQRSAHFSSIFFGLTTDLRGAIIGPPVITPTYLSPSTHTHLLDPTEHHRTQRE